MRPRRLTSAFVAALSAALAAALAAALGLAALACSTTGAPPSLFERHYQRYLSQPHQKAMALAGDLAGAWTYGYGSGYETPGLAIDRAMEICNARRHDLTIVDECRIYAVGNRVVEGDPELRSRFGVEGWGGQAPESP